MNNSPDWFGRQSGTRIQDCRWVFLTLAAMLPLLLPRAWGIGVRIPNQDAEAIARGNAFVATADNPSALYYNPAGITQLEGHNLQIGVLNYLGVTSQYESPTGARSKSEFEVVPVPQFYYTYTPKNCPVSLGLGVYAPFGLGFDWPESSGFRTLAIESRLQYITLNPVLAYKAHHTLSLAIGPTFNYSKLTIRRGLQTATDEFNFKGDDFAYGFNAGVLWQPLEKWSFGANYRSATTIDYGGRSSYSLSPAPRSYQRSI